MSIDPSGPPGRPGPRTIEPADRPVEQRLGFLPADVLSVGYLAITSTLVVLGHGRLPHWGGWLFLHLLFLAVVVGMRWVPRRGQ